MPGGLLCRVLVMPRPGLLAQMGEASGRILLWIGILIAMALAGGVLWLRLRKRVFDEDPPDDPASLIEQLRDARRRGVISEEEFQASRDSLLGRRPQARRVVRGEIFDDGTIRARPGFDLTGTPLPDPSQPDGPGGPG
ncbi:MAG: hypothetical protein IT439_06035 [Phycisphaerales bacterium]|nr:hypothetical protein [Phycisphaerales bacterium]